MQERADTQVSRRDRILDVTEELFSQHGYYGVTIRDIASRAKVELGLVTYHFPSKEELFTEVITRRAESLCAMLRESLAAKRAASGGRPPTVEALIDAFITPSMVRLKSGDQGWRNYIRVLGQVMNMHDGETGLLRPIREYYYPVVRTFIEAFREAVPSAEPASLYWSFYFLHLCVAQLVSATAVFEHSSKHFDSSDLDEVRRRIVPFFAAGFYRLAPG